MQVIVHHRVCIYSYLRVAKVLWVEAWLLCVRLLPELNPIKGIRRCKPNRVHAVQPNRKVETSMKTQKNIHIAKKGYSSVKP